MTGPLPSVCHQQVPPPLLLFLTPPYCSRLMNSSRSSITRKVCSPEANPPVRIVCLDLFLPSAVSLHVSFCLRCMNHSSDGCLACLHFPSDEKQFAGPFFLIDVPTHCSTPSHPWKRSNVSPPSSLMRIFSPSCTAYHRNFSLRLIFPLAVLPCRSSMPCGPLPSKMLLLTFLRFFEQSELTIPRPPFHGTALPIRVRLRAIVVICTHKRFSTFSIMHEVSFNSFFFFNP